MNVHYKGNCCPITCQAGTGGGQRYSSTHNDYGAKKEWVASTTPRAPLYTRKRNPVPIVQEARWTSGPIWVCPENLSPTGFEPRTVNSRYSDHAIPTATLIYVKIHIKYPNIPSLMCYSIPTVGWPNNTQSYLTIQVIHWIPNHCSNAMLFNQWYTDHLDVHEETVCNTVIEIYRHKWRIKILLYNNNLFSTVLILTKLPTLMVT